MFENLVSGVEDPSTPSAFGHVFLSLYTICIPALFLLSMLWRIVPPSFFFLFLLSLHVTFPPLNFPLNYI
jgi:hypothetical protein